MNFTYRVQKTVLYTKKGVNNEGKGSIVPDILVFPPLSSFPEFVYLASLIKTQVAGLACAGDDELRKEGD